MSSTTRHIFIAANENPPADHRMEQMTLLLRRAVAGWQASRDRRILALVEPRLMEDAGLAKQ